MRRRQVLFVLATLFALGLIGLANLPGDGNAVADSQAARLFGGGQCTQNYTNISCTGACTGGCADPGGNIISADSVADTKCGANAACTLHNGCCSSE
jgi:hypothetical protein